MAPDAGIGPSVNRNVARWDDFYERKTNLRRNPLSLQCPELRESNSRNLYRGSVVDCVASPACWWSWQHCYCLLCVFIFYVCSELASVPRFVANDRTGCLDYDASSDCNSSTAVVRKEVALRPSTFEQVYGYTNKLLVDNLVHRTCLLFDLVLRMYQR